MKTKILILLGLVILLFIFDFVPVKFAQKDTDIIIDNKKFVFCYEPKTLGFDIVNWIAYGYTDNKINYDIVPFQVLIEGEDPYKYFTKRDFEPIKLYNRDTPLGNNKFILRGDIQKIPGNYDYETRLAIMIEDWDIVYPINRLSIRSFYTPKNYLTIYDYDWLKIMKKWFEK